MSKAACLCNGPSRVSYVPSTDYSFVIGCNIPWTDCDATIIVDEGIIKLWNDDPELVKSKVVYSERSWAFAQTLNKPIFNERCLGVRKVKDKQSHSSGHVAVEVLIEMGYTDIDVYGCDSWFNLREGDSYTRKYVPISSPNQELRSYGRQQGWKLRWQRIIESNPNVKITFIK